MTRFPEASIAEKQVQANAVSSLAAAGGPPDVIGPMTLYGASHRSSYSGGESDNFRRWPIMEPSSVLATVEGGVQDANSRTAAVHASGSSPNRDFLLRTEKPAGNCLAIVIGARYQQQTPDVVRLAWLSL